MRLIYTFTDKKKADIFSSFLTSEKINNQLEIQTNTDWGSPNYGDVNCQIWVTDEDHFPVALRWAELFEKEPENPIFKIPLSQNFFSQANPQRLTKQNKPSSLLSNKKEAQPTLKASALGAPRDAIGKITWFLIALCSLFFAITQMISPNLPPQPISLPAVPIFTSPVKKLMLYDYPKAFEIIDKLVALYGIDQLQHLHELPQDGQYILEKFYQTPYWRGFYELLLKKLQSPKTPLTLDAPLFEKIREGEVWRLFSPSLLHSDIFHILFNMLWLIVLGKQMEQRLSAAKYIFFIVFTGIFSNTCQYLMSGPNFIGFSGILCAMLSFIWIRQKWTPWEGYPLQKSTINFMFLFIGVMFFIQLLSFYMESAHQLSISPGIANTGHLSGVLSGLLLGRLSLFSWKN